MAEVEILAAFAHPDDAELVVGGTLALEARRGRRVGLLDLTRGESGSRGTPEIRERESAEAAKILGAVHRESLGLPDARLHDHPDARDAVVSAVRRLRPRVVLLPHWEQRHPDHSAASRIIYAACFLSGLRNYRPDLGDAHRPFKLLYAPSVTEAENVAPSFIVDITATWETKLLAIGAFASQFTPTQGETQPLALDRFQRSAETAARRSGQRIGVEFGEAFLTREPLKVDDLLGLGAGSF